MCKLGFQLSSLTPYLGSADAVNATLAKVAEIGYRYVQLQGVPNTVSDSEIASALRSSGLKCVATQEDYPFGFGDDPERGIARAAAVGAKYLSVALIPRECDTPDKLAAFADILAGIGEKAKAAGITLGFHPIGMDYRMMDDVPVYLRLMNLLPKDIQLTFCVSASFGKVPYNEVLRQFSGRVDLVHFKDSIVLPDGTEQLMPLGEGAHDFAPIYETCKSSEVKYIFAEQERWNRDAFDCAAASLTYLHGIGMKP